MEKLPAEMATLTEKIKFSEKVAAIRFCYQVEVSGQVLQGDGGGRQVRVERMKLLHRTHEQAKVFVIPG